MSSSPASHAVPKQAIFAKGWIQKTFFPLRLIIQTRWFFAVVALITLGMAFVGQHMLSGRLRALLGLVCFVSLVAACSVSPRYIRWKQVGVGLGLQLVFAFLVFKLRIGTNYRPVYSAFEWAARKVQIFLTFADKGSEFVFGTLAQKDPLSPGIVFAFKVLPTIVFVSAFFSVLQYVGLLRWLVRLMARPMMWLLGTSGAETLSVSAGVFLGQTEAPMLIRPFLSRMTHSELMTVMTGGFAHISAALIAVYISYKADAVGILTTSILAVPASLYLSKVMLPEQERPETLGAIHNPPVPKEHANVVDAFAAGTSQGLRLAANVGAMLITFLAFLAMLDYGLGKMYEGLTLQKMLGWLFSPIAALLGTPTQDISRMGELLGLKLAGNEHIAFTCLTGKRPECASFPIQLLPATKQIAAFALAGFANFASVGIQLGGLGGMVPERRGALARLALRALLVGFVVTLLNACLAVLIGL